MTMMELLEQKGMSRYSLAKASGIPWKTVSDICYGVISLAQCDTETVQKLTKALGVTQEKLSQLTFAGGESHDGKTQYGNLPMEQKLSAHLQKAINDYVQGEQEQSTLLDCLWGELYGSINADYWSGVISEEQADYLRKKYLFGEEEEEV